MLTEKTIELRGVVQGVGFRPSVYRFARRSGLTGWVRNSSGSVVIAVVGAEAEVDRFIEDLPMNVPPQARISSFRVSGERVVDRAEAPATFEIQASADDGSTRVVIPADLAMCADCARDVADPSNRRFRYPFTSCTNCGPRYTVVDGMPYDRARTTLAAFPLCDACRREYEDPGDRRFHAESTACADCGPSVRLLTSDGRIVEPDSEQTIGRARDCLRAGGLVAVRGLGGFQIAADAFCRQAVSVLRDRKSRPHKPFAVMCRNLDVIRRYCRIPESAVQVLMSCQSPIVILDLLPDRGDLPADLLSPDTSTLGVMLPTTPLHMLLMGGVPGDRGPAFDMLVMTSGNRGGEPICLTDMDVRGRLADIVDVVLTHDRDINLRNDDSVCAMQGDVTQVWRRARGFAPRPVSLSKPLPYSVLAMGAELKNTIAMGYEQEVVLSPHVGDLATPEALDGYGQVCSCFPRFLSRRPEAIAVDLHPDMHSTRLGHDFSRELGVPLIEVQHHHAHALSCMAEHGLERALALVFDGTGLGPDGTIWGGELLDVHESGYGRVATFLPVRLPGGDAAVEEPVRQAVARLHAAGVGIPFEMRECYHLDDREITMWELQCDRKLNSPLTHAAGRVFDALAVLLDIAPCAVSYEGQAAIRLEAVARHGCTGSAGSLDIPYGLVDHDGIPAIDWAPAIRWFADRRVWADRVPEAAFAFHAAMAEAAVDMVTIGLDVSGARDVVLTGGVFMNRILTEMILTRLRTMNIRGWIHCNVPPNDGGIALGQVLATAASDGHRE
ncbi:MAG: carbamoyltransferase HypF [Candidatus Pacebacteria bacterium]|nr:carbamoyltransferase HypF [Candidatus Paceibacterota bacterium]